VGVERLIFVEDTYGEDFHRKLLEKLIRSNLISAQVWPKIVRMPTTGCNPALARKTKARVVGATSWRMLFVVDSEGLSAEEASRRVLEHFGSEERGSIRVVVVHPRHEAWLCIGLGGDRSKCRSSPEDEISRIHKPYDNKSRLARYAEQIDVSRLLGEDDFRRYLDYLKWLLS